MDKMTQPTLIIAGTLTGKAFGYGQNRRVFSIDGIALSIDTAGGGNREPKVLIRRESQ